MTRTDTDPDDGVPVWLGEHVELYALAALTPAETARVERELAALSPNERATCEARIVETQTAMAGFASTYALEASPDLRGRVLSHVFDDLGRMDAPTTTAAMPASEISGVPGSHDADVVDIRPSAGSREPYRKLAVLAAAAVTLVVALGAGVLIGRTMAGEPSPSSIAVEDTQQEVLDVLTAGDATVSARPLADAHGTITVITSKTADRAVTLLRNQRRPISPDSTFQLWLVGGVENPVPAGLIPGDDTEPVVVDELGDAQVLAVTIEPAGGSAQPTTPILAQVPL